MFWQQQLFSGKELPLGGIGYVSAGANVVGVKVIDVT